jgi:predicted PhzF superfamily epimerase YddE/YHI9
MEIPFLLVDTFAPRPLSGASTVVLLPTTAPDRDLLAAIVAEVGAGDVAYVSSSSGSFHVRWFDREAELPLCTHATLAAARAVFTHVEPGRTSVTFGSVTGPIHVALKGDLLVTDLPRLMPTTEDVSPDLARGLRVPPVEILRAGKYVVVYGDEADLRAITIDATAMAALDSPGVIATAPGTSADFVCRTFAIAHGQVREEQVSASAQSRLVPYWSKRLGKTSLRALQLSPRGAEIHCEDGVDGRVHVAGAALPVAAGTFSV